MSVRLPCCERSHAPPFFLGVPWETGHGSYLGQLSHPWEVGESQTVALVPPPIETNQAYCLWVARSDGRPVLESNLLEDRASFSQQVCTLILSWCHVGLPHSATLGHHESLTNLELYRCSPHWRGASGGRPTTQAAGGVVIDSTAHHPQHPEAVPLLQLALTGATEAHWDHSSPYSGGWSRNFPVVQPLCLAVDCADCHSMV